MCIKICFKDFFGKSDPYLEFSRAKEDGSFVVVHRTEVMKIIILIPGGPRIFCYTRWSQFGIHGLGYFNLQVIKNTLNPSWKPFQLSVVDLCNADANRTIKVQCFGIIEVVFCRFF